MRNGWQIYAETFGVKDARAVLLHCHGAGESVMTLGTRRLANALTEKKIVLEAFEQHGHGRSINKDGMRAVAPRKVGLYFEKGCGTQNWVDHWVEMAQIIIEKHKPLPLILMGHSFGGMALIAAFPKIAELCKSNGVRIATVVLLAPGRWDTGRKPL